MDWFLAAEVPDSEAQLLDRAGKYRLSAWSTQWIGEAIHWVLALLVELPETDGTFID